MWQNSAYLQITARLPLEKKIGDWENLMKRDYHILVHVPFLSTRFWLLQKYQYFELVR